MRNPPRSPESSSFLDRALSPALVVVLILMAIKMFERVNWMVGPTYPIGTVTHFEDLTTILVGIFVLIAGIRWLFGNR